MQIDNQKTQSILHIIRCMTNRIDINAKEI